MLARPIHHIIVEDPPKWLLEEVEKHLRGFFWVGKKRANGGQCLVAWDNISKPKRYGGLGVKDLRLQGLALRVRWEWLRRTDESRPWQGLNLIADAKAQEVFRSWRWAPVPESSSGKIGGLQVVVFRTSHPSC
jgi:hypothetical protein